MRQRKIFQRPFEFLLFTSIVIAVYAWGMVYQTAYLFRLSPALHFYGFVICGTLCSYNFHWLLTPGDVPADASPKMLWHVNNRRVHWLLALVSFISACYFMISLLAHWRWLLASALFTFLYSAPKIPFAPFNLLKRVAYGKTVFLALAWMHITTMLPLLVAEVDWQVPHYLFCLHRFFLIYAICILFDLRDQQKDRQEGIKSMITQMNSRQVSIIYFGILACFFLVTGWLFFYTSVPVVVALALPGLLLLFFYRWFQQHTTDYTYYFLLDGLMVISLPLMLIFQF